ncbi:MAG: glycosyltransferase, partial [Allobaculum sp.]|nr:glycosyltransferase [Allobaculum sp.]
MRHLSSSLIDKGLDVVVHSLADDEFPMSNLLVKTYTHDRWPINQIGRSKAMNTKLCESVSPFDIIHAHGLWMQPSLYASNTARMIGCKFCLEIHGTLSKWALKPSNLKKLLSLYLLGQKSILNNADLLIATCEDEYNDI